MVLDGIEVRIRHKLSCTTTFDVFIVSRFAVAFYGSSSHPQLVALIAQVSCKYFQRCFYIDVYFSKISNIQPVLHTLQFLSLLTGTHYCSIIFNFLYYISVFESSKSIWHWNIWLSASFINNGHSWKTISIAVFLPGFSLSLQKLGQNYLSWNILLLWIIFFI